MAEYKPYLDMLFDHAETLMWQLSEGKDYFTNYDFIRRSAQKNQPAYIQFLNVIRETREDSDKYLFNIVHEQIGSRLSREAQNLGYEQDKSSGIREKNIWGDDTACVIYRRTTKVNQP